MGDNRRPLIQTKSRSKSRSRYTSRNPFINFLYHFRQQPEILCKRQPEIAKLGGARWRLMSDSERAPYIEAAKEIRAKEPRIKKPKTTKKGDKSTKATTNKNQKKITKRKCSKCGHTRGSPVSYAGSTDTAESFDKEAHDDEDDDDKTSRASGSRSRSRSDSRSNNRESNDYSDSDTTF